MEDLEWLNTVRAWVFEEILSKIVLSDEKKALYVDEKRMVFWSRAFTHELADRSRNNQNNYEKLEFIGDAIADAYVRLLMTGKYPGMSEGELTEMSTYYSSGEVQADILYKKSNPTSIVRLIEGYKMDKYNIASDIFEAIIGAIYYCAESVTPGMGYPVSNKLLSYYYSDIVFDTDISLGKPKNRVIRIVTRYYSPGLNLTTIQKKIKRPGRANEVEVFITPAHAKILRLSSKAIPDIKNNLVIGRGSGNTNDESEDLAYGAAYKWLVERGLTVEEAEKLKRRLDAETPEIKKYYEDFMHALGRNGFSFYTISSSDKIKKEFRKVYILKGIRSDGTKQALGSADGTLDIINVTSKLMEAYTKDPSKPFHIYVD